MNRIKVLTQRSIDKPSPSRATRSKPEKMVYENTKGSTTKPAIAGNSPKNSNAIFAAKGTAKRSIVSDTKKPDIVSVTEETTKALMPYVDKTNKLHNQPIHQDFTNLQPELKSRVSEYIFENKNNALEMLVDPNSSLFKAFRKVVLKEGPDAPLTMNAIKKFSDYLHKAELELGKRFAIISSIDSKYENAGVFRPKNPITTQISASEYLQTVWEMTDEERSLFEIFSKEYVQNHLSFFENGAVTNMDFSSYSRFVKTATTVGRPGEKGGRWVQPKDTIGKAFQYQKENPHLSLVDVLTKKLGWSQDYLKNNVLLALIDESTSLDDLQMPTRNHLGANGFFFDSGHTHGTLELEAIAPVIDKTKLAIGIWGLPDDHALHPSNAKPGNYLEVEKFLSSEVEVENIKRSMNTPLQELKPSDL
jgi:hypothetical protein